MEKIKNAAKAVKEYLLKDDCKKLKGIINVFCNSAVSLTMFCLGNKVGRLNRDKDLAEYIESCIQNNTMVALSFSDRKHPEPQVIHFIPTLPKEE
jgi:hypothetical protein